MPRKTYPKRRYRINWDKVQQRFWAKVDKSGECWIWTGAKWGGGRYGGVSVGGVFYLAHRVAWFLKHHGCWPEYEICHRCDNGLCVRPGHLFEGTHQENMIDCYRKGRSDLAPRVAKSALMRRNKTHCKNGHERTAVNLYVRNDGHGRACIPCMRQATREWRKRHARKKA